MRFIPKEMSGNGSLGTTGTLILALVLVGVLVYFVANDLLAWIGALILAFMVVYGVKASQARRVGGIHTRY